MRQIGHMVRRRQQVVFDDAVGEQMGQAAHDPGDARLVDGVRLVVVVRLPERLEVEDGEERETEVGQREEVRQRVQQRRPVVARAGDRTGRR